MPPLTVWHAQSFQEPKWDRNWRFLLYLSSRYTAPSFPAFIKYKSIHTVPCEWSIIFWLKTFTQRRNFASPSLSITIALQTACTQNTSISFLIHYSLNIFKSRVKKLPFQRIRIFCSIYMIRSCSYRNFVSIEQCVRSSLVIPYFQPCATAKLGKSLQEFH